MTKENGGGGGGSATGDTMSYWSTSGRGSFMCHTENIKSLPEDDIYLPYTVVHWSRYVPFKMSPYI